MSGRNLIWLGVAVVVGAVLRFWAWGQIPPALNWDEVSLGYNAYSLYQTGRDEWGMALPLIFRAYGDYKLPAYVYMAVPRVPVRLPSAILGVFAIVVAYALSTRFFSARVAAIAAFLVAISPWTLWLSRIALEANVGAFFVAAGMYYLLSHKYGRAILLLGISIWSYNSARVFVPLMLLFFFVRTRPKLSTTSYLLLATFFVPMLWQLFNSAGLARYKWLAILDEGAMAQINQLQQQPGGRLLYNKATYFALQFGKNYLSYLSPQFLFLKGGSHYQFSLPNHGLLFSVLLPFFYLGIWSLFRNSRFEIRNFLLAWLVLAPIAGSITRDSPHVLRAVVMLPLPMIISAVGVDWLAKKWQWEVVVAGVMLAAIWQGGNYLTQVAVYSRSYSWAWQYGYSQVVQFIKARYAGYDRIIFTKRWGEPHEFVLYFWPWDPEQYRQDPNLSRYFRSDWYWVDDFAKFRFVNDWEMIDYAANLPAGGRYLVVASPDHEPAGTEVYRVNFLDNKPAFIIKQL